MCMDNIFLLCSFLCLFVLHEVSFTDDGNPLQPTGEGEEGKHICTCGRLAGR